MPAKNSMVRVYMFSLLLLAVVPAITIAYLWLDQRHQVFEEQALKSRIDYVELRKHLLKSEVAGVLNFIEFERSKSDELLKELLQRQVAEGHRMMATLHRTFPDRGSADKRLTENTSADKTSDGNMQAGLLRNIVQALQALNADSPNGILLVLDSDGRDLLAHIEEEQPVSQKKVLKIPPEYHKLLVATASKQRSGYVVLGEQSATQAANTLQPETANIPRYSVYLGYYEPLGLSLVAVSDRAAMEQKMRQGIINRMSAIAFDPDNPVLFISDFEGKQLVRPITREQETAQSPVEQFDTTSGRFIHAHLSGALKRNGAFIDFSWSREEGATKTANAINYVKAYPEWGWIIGTVFFKEKLEQKIALEKKLLQQQVRQDAISVAAILTAFIILAIWFSRWFALQSQAGFAVFSKFFAQASNTNTHIDLDKLPYREFEVLARSANRMIDQRQHYEKALKISEKRFELAVHYAQYFLWSINFATGKMEVSGDLFSYLGYQPGELAEDQLDTLTDLAHPEDQSMLRQAINDMEGGVGVEYRVRAKDGSYRWLYSRGGAVEVDEDGRIIQALGITADISERKSIEQELILAKESAESANYVKSQFLSNMTHELRTPLNSILGFSQILLREQQLDAEQSQQVSAIASSGQHLLALINDILSLSKIESDSDDLHLSSCDVPALLSDIDGMIRGKVEAKRLQFICSCDGDLHAPVQLDPIKVKQILLNLLSNAVKYTQQGYVELVIHCDVVNEVLIFEVKDTGIGIEASDLSAIFQPFQKLGDYDNAGTGLGLVISRRLAELHGGHLQVESVLGQGSCFSLILPLVIATETEENALIPAVTSQAESPDESGETEGVWQVVEQAQQLELHSRLKLGDIQGVRDLLLQLQANEPGQQLHEVLQQALELLDQFNLEALSVLLADLDIDRAEVVS